MDSLRQAADKFLLLEKTEYRLILSAGKNKPLETVELNFIDEDFYHILGLHHLDDIDIPKNKKLLLSKILCGDLNDKYLSQSEYYDDDLLGYNIKNRIEHSRYLEEYLDSDDFTVSVYKLQHDNKTLIRADYLITCKRTTSDEEYYIFLRKRKETSSYGIVSCFPKNRLTYWGGKRYLMLKEKMDGESRIELFRHPNFKDEIEKKDS